MIWKKGLLRLFKVNYKLDECVSITDSTSCFTRLRDLTSVTSKHKSVYF